MRRETVPEETAGFARRSLRLMAGARFEMALLCLLLLTAGAVIWQKPLLERTIHYTPPGVASATRTLFADNDNGGKSTVWSTGNMSWACDLRAGNAYPYCGYELFTDGNKGTHGLNLSNMRSFAMTLMYKGSATSFRVHLKNFDPRYSTMADIESPKFLRVEADTTPGKLQHIEFVPTDFGVADWWLRKRKLPPEFGRPQFDNITSFNIETGSEAPLGPHSFEIRDVTIKTAILSDAQWYSLLLGIWIVMIVIYLGYRVGNLRRAQAERLALEAMALREAQEAARRDHLTGIFNRRGLMERFNELAGHRRGAFSLAVILLDLDHFKALNDTHGHDQGDRVLSAVAQVINGNVRSGDLAARWGGEEFIVVCADVDRRAAQKIAEKIRERVEAFDFGIPGGVTASLGVNWSNMAEPDLTQLVAQADIALYAAKAEGRNRVKLRGVATPKAA
ncbi:GGDEF domain-containing protein [Asticcacaulis solisilvae]|uniref:GGDEF domain-containing protein n=1 Tax=Asticcacaulis solisilvae TaxID=1217274 RepID=UPI003FD81965